MAENVEKILELIHKDHCQTIHELADAIKIGYGQKRLELWCNHNWLLHHDNPPTHTSMKSAEFVTNNMVIATHPPYLPDLAPCHFALSPKLKMKLKGRRF
jgi:hypothetical protein